MLNNLREVITQKGSTIDPLPEELEICKALIQDKINEVVKLQEEISLLQEFVASKRLNSAAPNSALAGQAVFQTQ
jgi:hypothetical protein